MARLSLVLVCAVMLCRVQDEHVCGKPMQVINGYVDLVVLNVTDSYQEPEEIDINTGSIIKAPSLKNTPTKCAVGVKDGKGVCREPWGR